jgi:hypothetical protein
MQYISFIVFKLIFVIGNRFERRQEHQETKKGDIIDGVRPPPLQPPNTHHSPRQPAAAQKRALFLFSGAPILDTQINRIPFNPS